MSSDVCDWSESKIGAHRYTGTVAAAIERYTDIPPATRRVLIERMDRRQYDGVVQIDNNTPLARMNYGRGIECATVKRGWRAGFHVSALRYTVDGYTVLFPSVCGNVVRSAWTEPKPAEPAPAPEPIAYEPPASGGGEPISGPVTFAEPLQPELVTHAPEPWNPPSVVFPPIPLPPIVIPTPPIPAVAEPGTLVMVLAGLLVLIFSTRSQKAKRRTVQVRRLYHQIDQGSK